MYQYQRIDVQYLLPNKRIKEGPGGRILYRNIAGVDQLCFILLHCCLQIVHSFWHLKSSLKGFLRKGCPARFCPSWFVVVFACVPFCLRLFHQGQIRLGAVEKSVCVGFCLGPFLLFFANLTWTKLGGKQLISKSRMGVCGHFCLCAYSTRTKLGGKQLVSKSRRVSVDILVCGYFLASLTWTKLGGKQLVFFFVIGQMGLGTHTLSTTQGNINLQQRRDYK